MPYNKKAIILHKKNRGKIEIKSKVPLKTVEDLSTAYTPGVGAVCMEIAKDKNKSWNLTNRGNQVAIVCDGTAVLGLGDIGPEAGMPVMEGKSVIFKKFAGIDAVPLCIDTTDTNEIVNFCKLIAPSFGGINLEDIAAPRCFDILQKLEDALDIPVFHDDQDGTAIVVLAALINACKVAEKNIKKIRIIVNGGGAAGFAITKLLLAYGVGDILMLDSKGIIYCGRKGMNNHKCEISKVINKDKIKGSLIDAMNGSDVFIGVSKGNLVDKKLIKSMNDNPIVFAMANPVPEVMPDIAKNAGAKIIGTGRSDFPNQINNALIFPGIFQGLLQARIKKVTQSMKLSAAIALAKTVKNPTIRKILPNVTDKNAVTSISNAIKNSSST